MRLLLVEDNKILRESLKKSLQSESFVVDIAPEGAKGSYMARTNDYDLILLDNGLPEKNGLEVCREIRSRGKSTPIIMLTIQDDTDTKVELLNAGADDYVTKPFSFDELMARIRAIMRRPKVAMPEVVKISDLLIDLSSHSVRRGDREVSLTKKEYELLEYLARNSGRVVSRGSLLEHVWDMNADPFSNTLETHMLNLRRKIDTAVDQKLIYTVSGRGYKLDIKK